MLRRSLLLASLLLVFITACTPAPQPIVRIGSNIWPGYEPLYLARSLGWLKGSNIRLNEYNSSTGVMRALRDGSIEAGTLTLDEVLTLADDDVHLRIVLLMDVSHGADAVIARSGLHAPADLRGRKIGVEASALGAYMLSRMLEKSGLKLADVHVLALPLEQHEAAFAAGKIDAVVSFEPVKSRLLAHGGQVIFDSSQISGEIVDVLAVRESFLARHPDVFRQLTKQWFRALDYMQQHPADAAEHMQPRLHLSIDKILQQYRGLDLSDLSENRAYFAADAALARATRLMRVMRAQGLLRRDVDMTHLFSGKLEFDADGAVTWRP
ncbi:MAG: ABC transporter substrate-binding protein [Mariprofundaceae bacterium]|nr:ABC transporter substrate-binding protein [Mariprofundaceae bacterium]